MTLGRYIIKRYDGQKVNTIRTWKLKCHARGIETLSKAISELPSAALSSNDRVRQSGTMFVKRLPRG